MATRTRKKATPDDKPKRGRPSTYSEANLAQIKVLARMGCTDAEIAEFFGITDRAFRKWKHLHPELVPALKMGQTEANDRVKRALYSKAVGYTHDTEEVYVIAGKPTKVAVKKHVPPSDTAAIFWLKNREREEWRDIAKVEHTGLDDGPIKTENVNIQLPADPIEAALIYQKIMTGGE